MWRRRKDILKRRLLSGILACLLVATTALNTVGIISAFAGEDTDKPRISYKYHGKQDVQITVLAENESFAPGAEVALKIYIQNNTDQLLTEGNLKWSGKDLEEAGFPEFEAEDWSDLEDDLEEDPDDDEDGSEPEWGIGPGGTPSDAETGTPSNPDAESDGKRIKNIQLAPGEVYETEFYGYVSEELETIKNKKITFSFTAKKEDGGRVSETKDFTYNTGMAGLLPIEFEDGNTWMTNERNTMYIRTRFEDENLLDQFAPDYFEGTGSNAEKDSETTGTVETTEEAITIPTEETEGPDAAVEIEAEETQAPEATADEETLEAEVESGAAEEETTVEESETTIEIATEEVPLAENAETSAVTEAETTVTETEETTTIVIEETSSDDKEFLDPDDPDVATVSDATDEGTDPKNIRYTIETYGARLKGITAWYEEGESSWGETVTGVSFRVEEKTKPGTYFGRVTTSIRRNGKSYETSQGFCFYVLGEGELVLKGRINGAQIEVRGPRESFPEGDMLSLKVTEVPEEKQDLVQQAMEQKAEDEGIAVNKMKAVDIKIIADGQEMEPLGDVTVTFSKLELEEVEGLVATADETIEETESAVLRMMSLEEEETTAAGNGTAAEDESTLTVWHLNEEAGVLNDMGGEVDENGDVVMTTDHFSVFVVVDMGQLGGNITLTVEHWGSDIKTIEVKDKDGQDTTNPQQMFLDSTIDTSRLVKFWQEPKLSNRRYGFYTKDDVFDRYNETVKSMNYNGPIYSTDIIKLPNKKEYDTIEKLSKVCLVGEKEKNYFVNKIVINGVEFDTVRGDNGEIVKLKRGNEETDKITLNRDTVIRFIYKEKDNGIFSQPATFYDHNVSNGGIDIDTEKGTNSPSNFSGSGRFKMGAGQYSSGNHSPWAAHHKTPTNGNTPVVGSLVSPIGQLNGGNRVTDPNVNGTVQTVNFTPGEKYTEAGTNQYDTTPAVILKGIVTGLDEEWNLIYADFISQPGFFEEKLGTKKFADYKLGFKKNGDTYVLSTVVDGKGNTALSGLEKIRYSSHSNIKTIDSHIYSNEFWPLDGVNYTGMDTRRSGNSDDGKTHNWHFGMRYDFSFRIGDYVGPMNFYFRGDDDFWLFLDGELIVDLGGIHSAVGQAVDLKPYLEENGVIDGDKQHRLSVFYMERGGFGSCCYMQFTIPNCEPIEDPSVPQTTVTVKKDWDDYNNPNRPEDINVTLYQMFGNEKIDKGTVTLSDANQWQYTWTELPTISPNDPSKTYKYQVEEEKVEGYSGQIIQSSGNNQNGWIITIKNTLSPEVKVKVTKAWEDDNNTCHNRPQELKFQLYADGELYPSELGVLVVDGSQQTGNTWVGTFDHLPKYRYVIVDGKKEAKEIVYTVRETDGSHVIESDENGNGTSTLPGENPGENYKVFYEDNQPLTSEETNDGYVAHTKVTNTHKHQLEVEKIWSEGNAAKINADREKALPYVGLYEVTTSADGTKSYTPVREKYQRMTETNSKITAIFTDLDPAKQYAAKELTEAKLKEGEEAITDYDFVIPIAGKDTYFKGVEESGFYQECYQVEYEGPINKDNHSYPCIQVEKIHNELRTARLRVAKWITNWNETLDVNDLADDEFIIQVKKQISAEENLPDVFKTPFETGVVLKHAGTENGEVDSTKISGYIEVLVKEGGDTFSVSEIIPKEYQKEGIRYIAKYTPGQSIANATGLSDDTITVNPGDDGLIVVYNTFDHEDYFHHDTSVTNLFKENGKETRTGVEPVSMAAFIPMPEDKEKKEKLEQLEENTRLM